MSIGSWQRSTPGATSVTSAVAALLLLTAGAIGHHSSVTDGASATAEASRCDDRRGVMGAVRRRVGARVAPAVAHTTAAVGGRPAGASDGGRGPGRRRDRVVASRWGTAGRAAATGGRAGRRRRPVGRRHRGGGRVVRPHRVMSRHPTCRPDGSASPTAAGTGRRQPPRRCSCSSTPTSALRPTCSTGWPADFATRPGGVVSLQPWHDAVRPVERLSVLANVVALMGSGSVHGRR